MAAGSGVVVDKLQTVLRSVAIGDEITRGWALEHQAPTPTRFLVRVQDNAPAAVAGFAQLLGGSRIRQRERGLNGRG